MNYKILQLIQSTPTGIYALVFKINICLKGFKDRHTHIKFCLYIVITSLKSLKSVKSCSKWYYLLLSLHAWQQCETANILRPSENTSFQCFPK